MAGIRPPHTTRHHGDDDYTRNDSTTWTLGEVSQDSLARWVSPRPCRSTTQRQQQAAATAAIFSQCPKFLLPAERRSRREGGTEEGGRGGRAVRVWVRGWLGRREGLRVPVMQRLNAEPASIPKWRRPDRVSLSGSGRRDSPLLYVPCVFFLCRRAVLSATTSVTIIIIQLPRWNIIIYICME